MLKMVKELSYWLKKTKNIGWMADTMLLAQKTGFFFLKAMKIEVTENLVTINISLKRQ